MHYLDSLRDCVEPLYLRIRHLHAHKSTYVFRMFRVSVQERVALWVVFSFIPARLARFFKSDYNESDLVSPKGELLAQSHQE